MLALGADDVDDLLLEQLGEHAKPEADTQRQQPLLRRADQLAQRFLHARRQRRLGRTDLLPRYGLHGGSSCLDDDFCTRHGRFATGRGGRTATSSSTSYGTTSPQP